MAFLAAWEYTLEDTLYILGHPPYPHHPCTPLYTPPPPVPTHTSPCTPRPCTPTRRLPRRYPLSRRTGKRHRAQRSIRAALRTGIRCGLASDVVWHPLSWIGCGRASDVFQGGDRMDPRVRSGGCPGSQGDLRVTSRCPKDASGWSMGA